MGRKRKETEMAETKETKEAKPTIRISFDEAELQILWTVLSENSAESSLKRKIYHNLFKLQNEIVKPSYVKTGRPDSIAKQLAEEFDEGSFIQGLEQLQENLEPQNSENSEKSENSEIEEKGA